ncbi:MAG: flagellar biosynthetic protein FliO [Pseudomonadota bacterium]|nr:flagellar biosynthetic protein FliO [Pseudomonadota bacterium]
MLGFSQVVLAEQGTQLGESVVQPSDHFMQIVLSLVLVLLIIFLSAWMLRRYGRFPGVADGNLKVLGALSVGQRERVLLLQVGKEQILVGVTSSRISTLHHLNENVEVASAQPVNGSFASRLQEALSQKQAPVQETSDSLQTQEKRSTSSENS